MKPKNRAQLVRYLATNPLLVMNHPGGLAIGDSKTEDRVFIRMQANHFVFKKPDGRESYLDCKASEMSFDDKGFDIKFPTDWKDMVHLTIRYNYVDQVVAAA